MFNYLIIETILVVAVLVICAEAFVLKASLATLSIYFEGED